MYSEDETVKLMQECDSGVKMSVESLKDAAERADNGELRTMLRQSINDHEQIGREITQVLKNSNAPGKAPNTVAKVMSKIKIGAEMAINSGDETTAKLMYDGCSMGIEKLSEYINMYPNAGQSAKNIAEKLINCEQKLSDDLRQYL